MRVLHNCGGNTDKFDDIVDMLQNFCISNLHIFTDDGAICSAPKKTPKVDDCV